MGCFFERPCNGFGLNLPPGEWPKRLIVPVLWLKEKEKAKRTPVVARLPTSFVSDLKGVGGVLWRS